MLSHVTARSLLTTEQVLIVISGWRSGGLIRVRGKGLEDLCVCRSAHDTVALSYNGFFCVLLRGCFGSSS